MKKLFLLIICLTLSICVIGCAKGADGTTLFEKSKPSKEVLIELMDEDKALIVDNKNISRIFAKHNDDLGFYIEFKLTNKGKRKLAASTKKNIGKCIGVYIDGSPFAIADITQEMKDGRFYLSSLANEEEMMEVFNTFIQGNEE